MDTLQGARMITRLLESRVLSGRAGASREWSIARLPNQAHGIYLGIREGSTATVTCTDNKRSLTAVNLDTKIGIMF